MFHKGAEYPCMGYSCDISRLSLISGREFKFHARKFHAEYLTFNALAPITAPMSVPSALSVVTI